MPDDLILTLIPALIAPWILTIAAYTLVISHRRRLKQAEAYRKWSVDQIESLLATLKTTTASLNNSTAQINKLLDEKRDAWGITTDA